MNSNFLVELLAEADKGNCEIQDLELLETEVGLFPGSSSITGGDCCPSYMGYHCRG